MSYQLYPSDLTDTQWQYIKDLIPAAQPGGRPRSVDMRLVVHAIFYVVLGGIQWRMLPHDYPKWQTCLSIVGWLLNSEVSYHSRLYGLRLSRTIKPMSIETKSDLLALVAGHQHQIYRFGVKRLGVFGSFVRSEHDAASDVDVLVEFEPGRKTFDNFMHLAFYLEDLFGRKRVAQRAWLAR